MVQISSKDHIVYMMAKGKLDDDDYDEVLPLLRKKIEEYGRVSWYFEMEDFKGWSFNAFWRDIQFDAKNKSQMEKVAIVGENEWQEAMTDFMKPFADADIQYFDDDKASEAKEWIES